MEHTDSFGLLTFAVALLGAAVLSVPIANKLRLSAIIAYLAAGILMGPFGSGLVRAPGTILGIAELGVVLLLFLIGLELEPSRLFKMRRDIFGLGAAQLALTAAAIAAAALVGGISGWRGALIGGLALALSSTAIALRTLEERGDLHMTYGQRAFAILLFQDLAVVPLLALVPLLSPWGASATTSIAQEAGKVALIVLAIAALVVAGRYLLNPFFRLLAGTGAREVMTAAALLVVLGSALLMHTVGMSMALGAFLAGVLLAESNYRHELEADIEPFRGLLLALFFMGIGMSIDLGYVRAHLWLIVAAALAISVLKALIVWGLFRATCARHNDALRAGAVLMPAGEFAFVLIPLSGTLGLLASDESSMLVAVAAMTMLFGPPLASLIDLAIRRRHVDGPPQEADDFDGVGASVLLIGFGRFGQIVSQCLLGGNVDVTIIDNNPARIQNAARFGFKIYYGDGTRLDVLRAAGATEARLVAVCVDVKESANRIAELVRAEFPGTTLFVRSYDRAHTLELIARGVDYELRETYESAMVFGEHALAALGVDEEQARDTVAEMRRRDSARLVLQQAEGILAGADMVLRTPTPEPLGTVRRRSRALNPEAGDLIRPDAS